MLEIEIKQALKQTISVTLVLQIIQILFRDLDRPLL
jgi:hypothetical protein